VADDGASEAAGTNEASTGNKLFELLLHFFLVMCFCFALRLANGAAQTCEVERQLTILDRARNALDDQVSCL